MKSIIRTASLAILAFTPVLASAQISPSGSSCVGIACIGVTILNLINGVLVPVLFAIAFIMFIYGIAKAYIFSHGDPAEVEKGHKLLLWGLIGFAVMISLWGLVYVVTNTFGLAGFNAPTPPTSYPR